MPTQRVPVPVTHDSAAGSELALTMLDMTKEVDWSFRTRPALATAFAEDFRRGM